MAQSRQRLTLKTRATHDRGRWQDSKSGHVYLRTGRGAALVFRAHRYLQTSYRLVLPLSGLKSVHFYEDGGKTRLVVTTPRGITTKLLLPKVTTFTTALSDAHKAATDPPRTARDAKDGGPVYWATGTYDPDRYYRETRGWTSEYRDYVHDAYGDLDTYESNQPD